MAQQWVLLSHGCCEALPWTGCSGDTQAFGDRVFMAACPAKPALSLLVPSFLLPPPQGTGILVSSLGSASGFPTWPSASGLGLSLPY